MTKTKQMLFGDLRRLLSGLGYAAQQAEKAWIFHQAKKNLLIFRRYEDDEPVGQGDLATTRLFLDQRGLLGAAEFDALMRQTRAPA